MISERIYHVCDTGLAVAASTITAASAAVLGLARPYNPDDQLWQTVLPLIGATLTSFGAVLLNPQIETRRIVIGRATFGFFIGLITPSLTIAIAPNVIPESWNWIVDIMRWPGALIGMGGVAAFAAYVLSKPFCASAYERAGAIAKAQVKRIEEMVKGPNNTVVILDPHKMPEEPEKTPPP